jgi:hypothetical protein
MPSEPACTRSISPSIFVSQGSRRRRCGAPGPVCGGGSLYLPTHRLDPEPTAVTLDERAHLGRAWSSSRARSTLAAFRISLDLLRSRFSRRSAESSSRSAVVSRSARLPAVVGLVLAHPEPQGLGADAQIASDLGDRTLGLSGDSDAALPKLGGVLRTSCHGSDSFLQDQVVLETEPPSNPGRFRMGDRLRAEYARHRMQPAGTEPLDTPKHNRCSS